MKIQQKLLKWRFGQWENLPLMSHTSPCKFLLFEEHLNTDGRYSHEAMDSEILDIYKIEVLNEK